MSETKKTNNIPEKTLNYVAFGKGKEIQIIAANEQIIDDVPGIPMEIEPGDFIITNETEDGRTKVIDKKTGKLMGYLDSDGTLNRKLNEKDKKAREEGIEH